jgi:flagellar biosynthesis protein FlhB
VSANKTEDPTPKKQRKAREEGNVAKSAEFTGVAVMVTAVGVLFFWTASLVQGLGGLVVDAIALSSRPDLSGDLARAFAMASLGQLAWLLFPLLGATFLLATAVSYAQVGALFAPTAILPDLKKLNPAEGFKQLVSKDKAVELVKNLLKIGLMATIGWAVLRGQIADIVVTPRVGLPQAMQLFEESVAQLGAFLVAGLIAFGIFDLWWRRRQWWEKLKMSKKEVMDEHKQAEGDPHIKGKRKQMHRELLEEAAAPEAVQNADAVVVNPTHVAVAIGYDRESMSAPEILTSGADEQARTIKQLARGYDVPIFRDVSLARSLYDCDAGSAIPEEFYEPVAVILREVYRLTEEDS